MRIIIAVTVDDEDDIDETHPMGITNDAFERIDDALRRQGLSDIEIVKE